MKITQDKQTFSPITLVLETELEAEIIKVLIGSVGGDAQEVRLIIDDLYDALDNLGILSDGVGGNVLPAISSNLLMKQIETARGE